MLLFVIMIVDSGGGGGDIDRACGYDSVMLCADTTDLTAC